MNSEQEIQEAIAEYHKTQFGGWPWPSYDHVHSKSRERLHSIRTTPKLLNQLS